MIFRLLLISIFALSSGAALADGIGDAGGVHGIGSTIYGNKKFLGTVTLSPITDKLPLALVGHAASDTSPIFRVQPYAGSTQTTYIDNRGRLVVEALSDTDNPMVVQGHSATQSGDLFYVNQYNTATNIFTVRANGDFDFVEPTDITSYIDINHGSHIQFTTSTKQPIIETYNAGLSLKFETSTTDGAADVKNITISPTGTEFGAPVSSTASCDTGYTRAAPEYCVNSTPSSSTTFSGVSCSIIPTPASAKVVDLFLSISGGGSVQVYTDSGCTTQVLNAVAVSGETAAVTRKILLPSTGANLRITGSGAYAFEGYND